MLRRTFRQNFQRGLLLTLFTIGASFLFFPLRPALADAKPSLTLNLHQGPLGVTLSLKGKDFNPGQALLHYIDSQHTTGNFIDLTTLQIQADGSFGPSSATLPGTGPAGDWMITVTDSNNSLASAQYTVLTASGQQAGAPSLAISPTTVTPTNGAINNTINFTGKNWLPQGTLVNVTYTVGTSTTPILATTIASDENGNINGNITLSQPINPGTSLLNINAVDAARGALHAQGQIIVLQPTPSPTLTPTSVTGSTPTSTVQATASSTTIVSTNSTTPGGPNNSNNSSVSLNGGALALILLIVGGTLGIAALMLILFMIPWGENRRDHRRSSF